MAQLAQGIVGGQMAWGLLLMGCFFGLALVMIGAPSPMLIAVGMYLPLETTGAIFVGGVLKWAADQWAARKKLPTEEKAKFEERGTLLASGFIAGEAITGILLAALFLTGVSSITKVITGFDELPFLANWGGWISLVAFAIIAYILIQVPLRKLRKA
jgi:uncharacterized oligopeptide transporter (OPT) family protein